ncbi:MAG: hypothetical protein RXR16_08655 [Thermocladium sp.]
MSEINNGENETESKNVIVILTTDEVVGLIMQWAEAYELVNELPVWAERMIRDMQDKYDSINNKPTEEEKIDFINIFVFSGIMHGSFTKSVALRFLLDYNANWILCGDEESKRIEENETESKNVIVALTSDDVVGLIMEEAKAYELPVWQERMIMVMQDKYASIDNKPTEEEKIDFINTFAHGMPNGSFVKDIALQFLANYNANWILCGDEESKRIPKVIHNDW